MLIRNRTTSNDWLPESCGEIEKCFNFSQVTTDSIGNVSEKFRVALKPEAYNVKLFVKDIDDWKIVLYNDILIFTIIEKPTK